jgi:D-tyrosyl-tRNA(Tyr) deacylase
MRAVVQRVNNCSVMVNAETVSSIQKGLLVYLGVSKEDQEKDIRYTAEKIVNLRIFPDSEGTMNKSLIDIQGEILIVSQFTLYGDTRKGRRPSYNRSAPADKGAQFYQHFLQIIKEKGFSPAQGVFQAHMDVSYTNDGPVTIIVDSEKIF